jgi:Domain of unknown function (DUF397)
MAAAEDREHTWLRPRRCSAGMCVEVAFTSAQVLVRSSRQPQGPVLSFTREEWEAFVDEVVDGEFRLPDPG